MRNLHSELGVFLPILVMGQTLVLVLRVSGLHNTQLLVDVGEKVIQKNNPYLPMQPYSAFPGFIYRVIDFFSFGMNSPIIFILLNLIGIYSLINFLLPDLQNKDKLFIFSILLFTSPIRALVANVQHTGIILGSLILGVTIYRSANRNSGSLITHSIGILFLVFALEIKPQIAIPFIIVWLVQERIFRNLLIILSEVFTIHFLIDVWVGRILELDQLKVWLYMKNDALTISEQTSLWKLLQMQNLVGIDWFKLSFAFYFIGLFLLAYLALRRPTDSLLRWAVFLPTVTAYLHLYDLITFAIVICYWAIFNARYRGAMLLLGLITIPTRLNSLNEYFNSSIFIFAVGLIIFFNWNRKIYQDRKSAYLEMMLAFFTVLIISRLHFSLEEKVSIQVTMVMTSVILIMVYKWNKVKQRNAKGSWFDGI